jgi:hypothetical protein
MALHPWAALAVPRQPCVHQADMALASPKYEGVSATHAPTTWGLATPGDLAC